MTAPLVEIMARAIYDRADTVNPVPWDDVGDEMHDWISGHAQAALSALEAAGWVVVPCEITEAMACAAECAWGTEAFWTAAIAARPGTVGEGS